VAFAIFAGRSQRQVKFGAKSDADPERVGIRSDVLVTGPHFDPIVPKCIECEAWASRA
jgi:hypothetical protein